MHVHVVSSDGEAKFWLEPEIELARNYNLTPRDLREIPHPPGRQGCPSVRQGRRRSPGQDQALIQISRDPRRSTEGVDLSGVYWCKDSGPVIQ